MLLTRFLDAKRTIPLVIAFVIVTAAVGTGLVNLMKNTSRSAEPKEAIQPLSHYGPGSLPSGNYPAGSLAVGDAAPPIQAQGWLNGPYPTLGTEPKLTVVDICALW